MPYDDSLTSFQDIEQPWGSILVGNGASRAISASFAYDSLYDTACSSAISNPLAAHEQQIFDALETKNFEQVLSALTTAILVNNAYNKNIDEILASYNHIRQALVDTVHAVHVPFADVANETLLGIRTALLNYEFVYSTNYDLLLYWAVMQDPSPFRDYFFSGTVFDISNVEVWQKSTKLLFLHGALHLYKTRTGGTLKRSAGLFGNLLDDFGTPIADFEGANPLFVTEGTSNDKLRSIYTSDYLSFAYGTFVHNSGPLVIFGQDLAPQHDQHLISAIKGSRNRTLGIAIHPASTTSVAIKKAEWFTKFHNFELHFFDSTTHPLGQAVSPLLAAAVVHPSA